jgi:hypothetical protein
MPDIFELQRKKKRLVQQIEDNLDFLIGSVSSKGLKCEAYNLTTKIEGKTRTKHIPKDMVSLVRRMTKRHQELKDMMKELSEINWQLVKAGEDFRNHGTL